MQPEECLPKTVVRIEVDGKIAGTGFFTARDGQVLTCFHVVKDGQTGRLTDKPITVSFEGESYPARCIFTPSNPEQLDMALLRIEPRALPPGALVLPRVAWDGQQHTFYTYGFRSADAFQQGLFATGDILGSTVIANGSRRLQLLSGGIGEEALRQGMSGAPVVIEGSAQIVGMITDRHHTRGVEIIPLALPIQQIQAGCPFLGDITFVNREDEQERACNRFAPPYLVFDAPAGYGKTELLHKIVQQQEGDDWYCLSITIPKGNCRALSLAYTIAEKAGLKVDRDQENSMERLASRTAGFIEAKADIMHGLVLLIDNAERLAPDDIEPFQREFLVPLQNGLKPAKELRVRLAGRYIGIYWGRKDQSSPLSFTVPPLTPFIFRYVCETLRSVLTELKPPEADLRSAHLLHLTGGHPRCMAYLLLWMNFTENAETHFTLAQQEHYYQTVIKPIANEVHDSLPEQLQPVFDVLSVFRRCNYRLQQQMCDAKLLSYNGDLERDLTHAYLAIHKDGFFQDGIVRTLLAVRLRFEAPDRFLHICEQAATIYWDNARHEQAQRPELLLIEAMYARLQQLYYQSTQDQVARETLRKTFFGETGLLQRSLNMLRAKPDARDHLANLKARLEEPEPEDWEFCFYVNFFLRDTQYNEHPCQEMLAQIDAAIQQI